MNLKQKVQEPFIKNINETIMNRPKIPYYFETFLQKQGISYQRKEGIHNNKLLKKTWTNLKIEQEILIQKIHKNIIETNNNQTSLQLCKEINSSLDQIKEDLSLIALEEF